MEYQNYLKKKRTTHNIIEKTRLHRATLATQNRNEARIELLDKLRMLKSDNESATVVETEKPPVKIKKSRLDMLKEWKEEKKKKLDEKKAKAKPAFSVGVVHYKPSGSPLLENSNALPKLPANDAKKTGMVTRSRARLAKPLESKNATKMGFCKMINNKMEKVGNHQFVLPKSIALSLTIPQSPKITKSVKKIIPTTDKEHGMLENKGNSKGKKENILLKQKVTAIEEKMLPIENRKNLKSPDKDVEDLSKSFVHLVYSPFIEKRRGSIFKANSSSSTKLTFEEKIEKEIENEDTIKRSRIESFRLFLKNETERLLQTCDEWKNLRDGDDVPEEVKGDINAVAGKTNLLTSDKFKQFSDLIERCANNDVMVKVDDLQGFHDWICLEIDDLNKAFDSLTKMKNNNWIKENTPKIELKKKPIKKAAGMKKKLGSGTSRIRSHIQQLRQKNKPKSPDSPQNKLLDKSNNRVTPMSLQKTVSDESRRFSGFEIMRATKNCKEWLTPTRDESTPVKNNLSSSLFEIPTPASILRRREKIYSNLNKSVNFADSPVGLQIIDFATPPSIRRRRKAKHLHLNINTPEDIGSNKENATPKIRSKEKDYESSTEPLRRSLRIAGRTPKLC